MNPARLIEGGPGDAGKPPAPPQGGKNLIELYEDAMNERKEVSDNLELAQQIYLNAHAEATLRLTAQSDSGSKRVSQELIKAQVQMEQSDSHTKLGLAWMQKSKLKSDHAAALIKEQMAKVRYKSVEADYWSGRR